MRDRPRFTVLTLRIAQLAIVGITILTTVKPVWSQKTYYIDESTDFSGNGCENAGLNDVTSSLRSSLDSNGWSGQRWTNANAWPQDYYESTMASLSGDNSPIALTHGLDSNHCDWVRDTAKLRGDSLLFTPPEPWGWFCWIMYNHGASGC